MSESDYYSYDTSQSACARLVDPYESWLPAEMGGAMDPEAMARMFGGDQSRPWEVFFRYTIELCGWETCENTETLIRVTHGSDRLIVWEGRWAEFFRIVAHDAEVHHAVD